MYGNGTASASSPTRPPGVEVSGLSVRCVHDGNPIAGYRHTRYDGIKSKAPKRAKCADCGGKLRYTATVWAPVEWRADGRYECPAVTFTSPEAARAACVGEQVDRSFVIFP